MDNPYLADILATLSAMSLTPAQVARLREWIDGLGDTTDDIPVREQEPRGADGLPIDRR